MAMVIAGTGSYLPARVVDNHELEATTTDFDRTRSECTLDDWVSERIGVHSRHRVAEGEGTAAMALHACRNALDDAELTGADIDLIVLSTFTSDHRLPQSVSLLQYELGSTAKCIQLEAACAGFIDGIAVATALMDQQDYHHALVVHSDVLSAVIDPDLFLMQAIFADGSGAVVISSDPSLSGGLGAVRTWTDGSKSDWLYAGGGTLSPMTPERWADRSHYLRIDAQAIFGFAVAKMSESLEVVLGGAGHRMEDVSWVVAHQTGVNITLAVAEQVGIAPDRFLMTLGHTGNTSGATIPIALDHFNRQGVLAAGDLVAMPTVGAGMAWGAALCSWTETRVGHAARLARLAAPAVDDGLVIDLTDVDSVVVA